MSDTPDPLRMRMLDWLYGLQRFGVKLGLDSIRALLELVGHPESAPRSVLVGGTNGKGSVAAMLHAILGAMGVPAGMFTSPHLVEPTERIRLPQGDIGPAELDERLDSLRALIERALADGRLEAHPSFFEVITATALDTFRAHGLRAAVLEVGLGGRLDATNAVPADLAVITSVDLDHTKTLGSTIGAIAAEKGGIIKPGRPVVCGAVRQPALHALRAIAERRGAAWIDARRAVRFVAEAPGGALTFETDRARYEELRLALGGRHQIDNARIALAAWEELAPLVGAPIDPGLVRRGFAATDWPGRLDWRHPPGGPALLLDGAHNPQGARTLATELARLGGAAPVTVFGVMQGKLVEPMLASLGPHVGRWVVTRPDVQRAADSAELAARILATLGPVALDERPRPAEALAHARRLAAERGTFVLVTGSLYLVGEILGLLRGGSAAGPVSM